MTLEVLGKFKFQKALCRSSKPVVALLASLLLHGSFLGAHLFLNQPRTGVFASLKQNSVLFFESRVLKGSTPSIVELTTKSGGLIDAEMSNVRTIDASAEKSSAIPEGPIGPSSSTRFYSVSEVSQAATPYADWIVPWEVLQKAHVKVFVVQLWILDSGEVIQADVLQVTPVSVSQSTMDELSNWLTKTRASPALKDGRPVASVRTIEIALEI